MERALDITVPGHWPLYDSLTAHTAVVMTRYIIMAAEKRQNEDPRSFGQLFHLCYDELADTQFSDVLALIITLLRENLTEFLFLSDKQINEIIDMFVSKLSAHFKVIFAPESAAA